MMEANHMKLRSIQRAALCACVMSLAAVMVPARAQDGGPMAPPASTRFPTPPKAAKPEPPSIPPEEIIRRFAAKEDEMQHVLMGYSFQKSVRLEEIGPDNGLINEALEVLIDGDEVIFNRYEWPAL